MRAPREPYRVKMVEPVPRTTRRQREQALDETAYNLFLLPSRLVELDLLTNSGTGAMSQRQWAALIEGDESYAGSGSHERLREAVAEVLGFRHVVPVHQGRAAEAIFFALTLEPGMVVPSNGHFDTTRAHIELQGATALDLTTPAAHDLDSDEPFKGDIDLPALRALLGGPDGARVPYVMLTLTNNTGGGQPASLANVRGAAALAREHGKRVVLDIARFAENAWFVREREPGCARLTLREVARALLADADAVLMSAKKDGLANIGGLIAIRDDGELVERVEERCIVYEGFPTYGGLAGRDLDAIAAGLHEVLDERYLRHRVEQVAYLGHVLEQAGAAVLRPLGGHAVYLEATRMLPHLPRERFPGQALACALYLEGSVRGAEVGTLMAGRDPATGEHRWAEHELVRLAVPRRLYSSAQLDQAAEATEAVLARSPAVPGLELVHEARVMRHFTARFRPIRSSPGPVLGVGDPALSLGEGQLP